MEIKARGILLAAKTICNPVLNPGCSNTKPPGDILSQAVSTFLQLMLVVGFLGFMFYFILAGIQWITSGGDAKKTEAAGKQITNAIIGLLLLASGWAIISLVDRVLGLNFLKGGFTIPNIF